MTMAQDLHLAPIKPDYVVVLGPIFTDTHVQQSDLFS
jgi:hypothetical protein